MKIAAFALGLVFSVIAFSEYILQS